MDEEMSYMIKQYIANIACGSDDSLIVCVVRDTEKYIVKCGYNNMIFYISERMKANIELYRNFFSECFSSIDTEHCYSCDGCYFDIDFEFVTRVADNVFEMLGEDIYNLFVITFHIFAVIHINNVFKLSHCSNFISFNGIAMKRNIPYIQFTNKFLLSETDELITEFSNSLTISN